MHCVSRVLLVAALGLAPVTSAYAQAVLTDDNKMTLYTYDADVDGKSACYDKCAVNWPPYLGKEGETKGDKWTLVARTDGALQWSYDGKPLYYYKDDAKAGDVTGDGKGGVWHTIAE